MCETIDGFVAEQAVSRPDSPALLFKTETLTYRELNTLVEAVTGGLFALKLSPGDRVALYLPKQLEFVAALFAIVRAGLTFVPVNPLLKPAQVAYILSDCNVRALVTSSQRLEPLADQLNPLSDLSHIVLVDQEIAGESACGKRRIAWPEFLSHGRSGDDGPSARRIDIDMAAILYTSGSTGKPKGVVLSHRNLVVGAESVASYLKNTADDRLLAVLPFSFDYGLSQLTTAFSRGASVALIDYLLPRDVIKAVERYGITGLAAIPPLWNQLAELEWPSAARQSLRYLTNSGGVMPLATTRRLRDKLPDTDIYLMYGLTEAFRSTYLPPSELAARPDSIGKAIPNADILVVREDGTECAANEPGELVHRGTLVTMGYWNDPAKTAERFRPSPSQHRELPIPEIAVWSGDEVKRDEEGYLYFIGRRDEMIKTSGYRVSPTEVEDVLYGLSAMREAVAVGLPHPILGQAILALVVVDYGTDETAILTHCQRELPHFMVPQTIRVVDELPRNQNGKIDRKRLAENYRSLFAAD